MYTCKLFGIIRVNSAAKYYLSIFPAVRLKEILRNAEMNQIEYICFGSAVIFCIYLSIT